MEKLFVAIPSKADEPNLISELEAVAKKHQLIIPTISISTGDENGSASMSDGSTASPTNRVRVSFSVTGNFDSLSQFVASVEKDLRFSNIKNINIAASEDEMSLSLSIDVYMRANNQPVQDQSAQTMMTPGMMPTQ
ncbi:MAG: Pilus assembly protein, PilO [bacterium ADurb.Bin400]|nr:MAG: Pilus assembly protein, PilO [bacterium ADurb.Bin400]